VLSVELVQNAGTLGDRDGAADAIDRGSMREEGLAAAPLSVPLSGCLPRRNVTHAGQSLP